ncbi:MAG: metalloregulator ArsR/SmtB family transcription factor [Candidatus Firestonebacteria bacterium]|nr:metalloregulator ArsR/SmtB family transcription factor [Candidatus Firestonebacteria bacterium]
MRLCADKLISTGVALRKNETAYFKALSDPTRLRLATLLARHGEVCVCELAGALDDPEFKVSRHLSVLRSAGVVETRRSGTWMHYRLADPRNDLESGLQGCLRDCLQGHALVQRDSKRLQHARKEKPLPCATLPKVSRAARPLPKGVKKNITR